MMKIQEEIVIERQKWAHSHFYVELKEMKCASGYRILKRKMYQGLFRQTNRDYQEVLPTIYDNLSFITNSLVEAKLDRYIGYFSLQKNDWVVFPEYEQSVRHDACHSIELVFNGKHGLMDMNTHELVIPVAFDDVTICPFYSYLWVKRMERFYVIRKSDGHLISLLNAIRVYDDPDGIFVKQENGSVVCFNEEGEVDELKMRNIMLQYRGRKKVQNIKYHNVEIIDNNGYVLY